MSVLHKKLKLESNFLSFELPDEFCNKNIDITIKIDEESVVDKLLINQINIDTTKWKFDREKIYDNEQQ